MGGKGQSAANAQKAKSSRKEKKEAKEVKKHKHDKHERKDSGRHRFHRHKMQVRTSSQSALPVEQSVASVLVIGSEEQMFRMLLRFGPTDVTERHNVQQLLAIPCQLCDPNEILPATVGALHHGLHGLASRLRPDIAVSVRSLHLKKVLQQLGGDFLKLPPHFCLASVIMPYGLTDINASVNEPTRHWRQNVCNQIDLQVTAFAKWRVGETSLTETAYQALRDTCGISIAPTMWDEGVQLQLRRQLGADFPIKCFKGKNSLALALVLPSNATIETREGHLCFGEPAIAPQGSPVAVPRCQGEWQPLVNGPPHLPQGWCYVRSSATGEKFFVQSATGETMLKPPQHELPDGWCRMVSRSTGDLYFSHAEKDLSSFDPPLK